MSIVRFLNFYLRSPPLELELRNYFPAAFHSPLDGEKASAESPSGHQLIGQSMFRTKFFYLVPYYQISDLLALCQSAGSVEE